MTDFLLDHTAVNFSEPSSLLGLDFGPYLVFRLSSPVLARVLLSQLNKNPITFDI